MTHSNGWDQWQSGMLPGAHPTRNSRQNFVFFSMIHVARNGDDEEDHLLRMQYMLYTRGRKGLD